jgi:hypothetical protein
MTGTPSTARTRSATGSACAHHGMGTSKGPIAPRYVSPQVTSAGTVRPIRPVCGNPAAAGERIPAACAAPGCYRGRKVKSRPAGSTASEACRRRPAPTPIMGLNSGVS